MVGEKLTQAEAKDVMEAWYREHLNDTRKRKM
jgi:hypothetical protein